MPEPVTIVKNVIWNCELYENNIISQYSMGFHALSKIAGKVAFLSLGYWQTRNTIAVLQ